MSKKDVQAIKPDNTFKTISAYLGEKEVTGQELTDVEKTFVTMSRSSGWHNFKELTNDLIRDLDQINDNTMSTGGNFEEIGKNTLVISLAKGVIKRMIDKIEDAREASDNASIQEKE